MALLEDWDMSHELGAPSTSDFRHDDITSGLMDMSAPLHDRPSAMFTITPQYQPQGLVSLAISNDVVVVGLRSGLLERLNLAHAADIEAIRIVKPKSTSDTIEKVFVSPTGSHVWISIANGDNYYLHASWSKPVKLKSVRNTRVSAIAWNNRESSESTLEFLLGSTKGEVFAAKIEPVKAGKVDELASHVYSLVDKVTGLQMEFMDGVSPGGGPKMFVLATNPTRIFQFIGGPDARSLFENYAASPQFFELPGELTTSCLATFAPYGTRPDAFAWITAHGVYYGPLLFKNQGPGETITGNTGLLPYDGHGSLLAPPGEIPLALALTEFHVFLVYSTCFQVISRLSESLVMEEAFPRSIGTVIGVAKDPMTSSLWVYGSNDIFEVEIDDEARDVWSMYLERKDYDMALQYTADPDKRDTILDAQAQDYFDQGSYELAARAYARIQSSSFEETALKFIAMGEVAALKAYLLTKLNVLARNEATQRTLVCTWLTEIYLTTLNDLEIDSDLASTFAATKDEFHDFLTHHKEVLNINTTFHLISSHGRVDDMLFYANLIDDLERVITHHLHAQDYDAALAVIVRNAKLSPMAPSAAELFYKFGPVLMHHAPVALVNALVSTPARLEPAKLIPALTRYNPASHPGPNQAVAYLSFAIDALGATDPSIHNFMVSLLAQGSDEAALLRFLRQDSPRYDRKYALRLCTKLSKRRACVAIYTAMDMYEDAVDLALKVDLDLAIQTIHEIEYLVRNPDAPEFESEDKLTHKLWLKIAKHVLQPAQDLAAANARLDAAGRSVDELTPAEKAQRTELEAAAKAGVDQAIAFLTDNNVLRIENVLPLLPDFTVIDEFQNSIIQALTTYDAEIVNLERDMEDATLAADHIRADIKGLKNRYGVVHAQKACDECAYPLLSRDFYLFPCQHVFHFDCLYAAVRQTFSPALRAHVASLIDKVAAARDALAAAGPAKATNNALAAQDAAGLEAAYTAARDELDAIVARDCLYCGSFMIDAIDKLFIDAHESREVASWRV